MPILRISMNNINLNLQNILEDMCITLINLPVIFFIDEFG